MIHARVLVQKNAANNKNLIVCVVRPFCFNGDLKIHKLKNIVLDKWSNMTVTTVLRFT